MVTTPSLTSPVPSTLPTFYYKNSQPFLLLSTLGPSLAWTESGCLCPEASNKAWLRQGGGKGSSLPGSGYWPECSKAAGLPPSSLTQQGPGVAPAGCRSVGPGLAKPVCGGKEAYLAPGPSQLVLLAQECLHPIPVSNRRDGGLKRQTAARPWWLTSVILAT
jgi:hypothetical protein